METLKFKIKVKKIYNLIGRRILATYLEHPIEYTIVYVKKDKIYGEVYYGKRNDRQRAEWLFKVVQCEALIKVGAIKLL